MRFDGLKSAIQPLGKKCTRHQRFTFASSALEAGNALVELHS
jgi:hypothetical protein